MRLRVFLKVFFIYKYKIPNTAITSIIDRKISDVYKEDLSSFKACMNSGPYD